MKPAQAIHLPLGFLTLLYLALPLVIFFVSWCQPVCALAAVIPLMFCGWHLTRAWPVTGSSFRVGEIIFLTVFSFAITAFAGVGGFAPQEFDWAYHNPVLADCVRQHWPVILTDGSARWPLVYYLAYYLPAAVAGKMTGYAGAQAALWVWSSLGVMLSCGWFARLSGFPAGVATLAFFSFSGLALVANLLVQLLGLAGNRGWTGFYPYERWGRIWEIGSHFWMLEWSPAQALAGWLSAALFLASPKPLRPVCFGFLCLCGLLWSPFVAVGLGLVAVFIIWREGWEWPVKSLAPLTGLILPIGVLVAFNAAKISPEIAQRFPKIPICWFTRFQDAPYHSLQSVALLLLYIVFQFGIFWMFIRIRFPRGTSERNFADACGLSLLCLLPVTVGYYNDLAMRASIVPWFGLAWLTTRTLLATGLPGTGIISVAAPELSPRLRRWFWVVILIGALTPLIEFGDQGGKLLTGRYDPNVVPHGIPAVVHIPADGFDFLGAQYVGSTNSFYWRHLARQTQAGEVPDSNSK